MFKLLVLVLLFIIAVSVGYIAWILFGFVGNLDQILRYISR